MKRFPICCGLIATLSLLSLAPLRAQSAGWDVELADGSVVDEVTLLRVEADTLWLATLPPANWRRGETGDTVAIPVASIERVERAGGWNFLTGAGVGFGIGAGLGAAIVTAQLDRSEFAALGYAVYPPIGAAAGILLGGIVGAAVDDETTLVLTGKSLSARSGALSWIITSERYAR